MNGGAAVSGAVTVERRRRVAIGAAVTAVHVAVLIWLGVSVVPVLPEVTTRAFDVVLMRPATKPNPDSDSPISGGGAASAPSTVHLAPEPRLDAVELTAPTEPAPLQPLVLGVAPLISPSSSAGAGTGSGDGIGAGAGPGAGGSRDAVLIEGPAGAVITQDVQSAALVRAGQSHVILRCRIRLDQRLTGCRVIGEHPRPSGYRRAALLRSREFRFLPPQQGGRPVDGRWKIVAIAFPAAQEAEPVTALVDGS